MGLFYNAPEPARGLRASGLGYMVTVSQQVQREYNNNIVLTEVNKTVMFIVPNITVATLTHCFVCQYQSSDWL